MVRHKMSCLDAFRGFTAFSKIHGPEQAMKIIRHEKLVLDKVADFVATNEVDCDFDLCGTYGTPHFPHTVVLVSPNFGLIVRSRCMHGRRFLRIRDQRFRRV